MYSWLGKNLPQSSLVKGLLCSLTLAVSCSLGIPTAKAAETLTIRFGPFQQSLNISEIEKFAKTGKLPEHLNIYSAILTPQVGELLNRPIQVDPQFADQFVDELTRSPQGRQLISSLESAIPGSTVETLQAALSLSLRQFNGLSAIGFLRAYPQENITVDATQAVQIALAFNSNNLQNQVLGHVLERELLVKNNTPFRSSLNPAAPGQATVQQQTLTFQDRQRNRRIPVDIYWSQQNTQAPLVVLSHGFGANRQFFSYLARHLASHGITVAAIEHPGSNAVAINRTANRVNLAQLIPASEFVDRPNDVSFLLNELEKLNTQPGQLQGKLNTQQVTAIGHSLGGHTALALVGGEIDLRQLRDFCQNSLSFTESPGDWLQCAAANLKDGKTQVKDERIKSAIALNPLVGKLFGNNGLSKVTKPVLIVSSTDDAVTPILNHQIRPFNQLQGPKYLLTAIGATHLSITDPAFPASTATTLVREKRGQETEALRELIRGVTLAFIKQDTPEAEIYKPFLTPAYAQSLSTPEIALRLNTELPRNMKTWLGFAIN